MPFRVIRNGFFFGSSGFRRFRWNSPYSGHVANTGPTLASDSRPAQRRNSVLAGMGNMIQVKRGNVVVKVYKRRRVKKGREYVEYIVSDYSCGRRKLWTFRELADAKGKAAVTAEAIQKGQVDATRWETGLRLELRKALEV